MPNIRENSAPQGLGLNATEIGVDAKAGAARRAGSFYSQKADAISDTGNRVSSTIRDVGDAVVKYEDHREISEGAAKGAQQISDLNDKWNATLKGGKDADGNTIPPADPNDPSTAAKFREKVMEPALSEFKSGFNTERSQQWAEHFVDQYRQHMFEKTAADMSTMAGIAVKTNYEKTKNLLSSAVASDPSSLDFALKSVDHSVGAMADSSPNLDATVAAKVKTELTQDAKEAIVKSAIFSMIQKNPNIDLDAVQKKYGEYVNGAEMKMFQKAAQVQEKSNQWTQKQLETAQRKDIEVKSAAELSKNWTDNVTYDETGQVHVNPRAMQNIIDIEKKYPGANTADSQKMISFLRATQHEQREVVNSDQAVRGDLLQRMSSPDKFPTEIEILRAEAEHKLSPQDSKEMLALQKAITQRPGGEALKRDHAEFFKQYGPTIDPEMKLGNPTPLGAQGMYRAEMDAYRQEEALRQKGLDPHLVYDPRSEYFFGNPKNISSYRPTMQDQVNFKTQQKSDAARKSVNLTADGSQITGMQTTPAPVATSVPRPAAPKPPEKGFVKDGYEFLGGSAGDAANWRKVK